MQRAKCLARMLRMTPSRSYRHLVRRSGQNTITRKGAHIPGAIDRLRTRVASCVICIFILSPGRQIDRPRLH